MAVAARTIRAIKPHVPLIKFPSRTPGQGSTNAPTEPSSLASSINATSSAVKNNTSIEWNLVPERFHRKPISIEEMEYIERGGPE